MQGSVVLVCLPVLHHLVHQFVLTHHLTRTSGITTKSLFALHCNRLGNKTQNRSRAALQAFHSTFSHSQNLS